MLVCCEEESPGESARASARASAANAPNGGFIDKKSWRGPSQYSTRVII